MERAPDIGRLRSDVEWALSRGLGEEDLVPMLEKLVRSAPAGTTDRAFGELHLAERLVRASPWRAAALARASARALDDGRSWGVLGLALTMLGNYRAAARSYRNALARTPECPSCAHNLGHLLDVALDRPGDGLGFLRRATRALPKDPEVSGSLAHALARLGRVDEARRELHRTVRPERAEALLARWL